MVYTVISIRPVTLKAFQGQNRVSKKFYTLRVMNFELGGFNGFFFFTGQSLIRKSYVIVTARPVGQLTRVLCVRFSCARFVVVLYQFFTTSLPNAPALGTFNNLERDENIKTYANDRAVNSNTCFFNPRKTSVSRTDYTLRVFFRCKRPAFPAVFRRRSTKP